MISSAHEMKYDPSPKQAKETILTLEIGNVLNRRLYNLAEISPNAITAVAGAIAPLSLSTPHTNPFTPLFAAKPAPMCPP